jgi:exopolyphosphatase/guanosine-5'-triphosphate,3'-diphosphate pyrophosphatase
VTGGGSRAPRTRPPRRVQGGGRGAVAAVDCGTNSTRLLVVDAAGRHAARMMRITRLGQGVDATRRLDPAAVDRTLAVLREYREVMDAHGVGAVRMAATSAVRDATNGREFLDAAEATVGAPAELLSGEAEGRLAYAGATAGLPAETDSVLVVDIGGGSTELILGSGASVVGAVSMDLGCVRLTERYLCHDPPLAGELARATGAIEAELDRAQAAVPGLGSLGASRLLVGVAGTVSTVSRLDQRLAEYDRGRVHHSHLSAQAVDRWAEVLAAEPAAARALRAGMVEGRQDVIVGGVLLLRAVMHRWGFETCLVSESDILDGLAASLAETAAARRDATGVGGAPAPAAQGSGR